MLEKTERVEEGLEEHLNASFVVGNLLNLRVDLEQIPEVVPLQGAHIFNETLLIGRRDVENVCALYKDAKSSLVVAPESTKFILYGAYLVIKVEFTSSLDRSALL